MFELSFMISIIFLSKRFWAFLENECIKKCLVNTITFVID